MPNLIGIQFVFRMESNYMRLNKLHNEFDEDFRWK